MSIINADAKTAFKLTLLRSIITATDIKLNIRAERTTLAGSPQIKAYIQRHRMVMVWEIMIVMRLLGISAVSQSIIM